MQRIFQKPTLCTKSIFSQGGGHNLGMTLQLSSVAQPLGETSPKGTGTCLDLAVTSEAGTDP